MKYRTSYVTNSSSSSYIIGIRNLRGNALAVLADIIIKMHTSATDTEPACLVTDNIVEEFLEDDDFAFKYEYKRLTEGKYIIHVKKYDILDDTKNILVEIAKITDDVVIEKI